MARSLRQKWAGKRKFLIETSGGIEENNLKERAVNGECDDSSVCGLLVPPEISPRNVRGDESRNCAIITSDIDILSTSAVHQSVQHIDFSLKIQLPKEGEGGASSAV